MKKRRIREIIEESFVTVDGVRVHFERAGHGRPLLLLHGLVGSARNWRQNIDFLGRHATVYALDLCNMGESDRVPGLDAGLAATADRIAATMDALGLDEADVAGHSHGGAVAMMLAARHPARVRSLILFAPANPFCDLGRPLISFYQTRVGTLFARMVPALPRRLKATALSRMYGDPRAGVARAHSTGTSWGCGCRVRWTMCSRLSAAGSSDMALLKDLLSRVATKPTLLIWGDRDRAVGLSSAEKLQHMLTQSRLIVLPGVGHIPFEEMPEACNQAMREWLSRSAPAKRTTPQKIKATRRVA